MSVNVALKPTGGTNIQGTGHLRRQAGRHGGRLGLAQPHHPRPGTPWFLKQQSLDIIPTCVADSGTALQKCSRRARRTQLGGCSSKSEVAPRVGQLLPTACPRSPQAKSPHLFKYVAPDEVLSAARFRPWGFTHAAARHQVALPEVGPSSPLRLRGVCVLWPALSSLHRVTRAVPLH